LKCFDSRVRGTRDLQRARAADGARSFRTLRLTDGHFDAFAGYLIEIERTIVFKRQSREVDQKAALAVLRRLRVALPG
jgi:hypothetical protein